MANGIKKYIVIDSRNSCASFIKKNILNSELINLLNLNDVNWNKVTENSFRSIMHTIKDLYFNGQRVIDIAEELKISAVTVEKWLHKATDIGLCEYVPEKGFLKDKRKIICINTKEKFDSIMDAARKYNDSFQNITAVCQKKRKYSGMFNNQPMVWRYLDEYDENEIIDFNSIVNHRTGHVVNKYKDGIYIKTYPTIEMARISIGHKNSSNISACCRKVKKQSGGFQWFYADDPNQPDKSKIIS